MIVFWVVSESDKLALIQDERSPFSTTAHFDFYLSVLLRASRVGELSRQELAEIIQDAWLSRAAARRRKRGECRGIRVVLLGVVVDELLDVGLDQRTLVRISSAVAVQAKGSALVFQCSM